ncbi:putative virion structural protein [Pseudomonas phage OBP]|uniref:internal head protein n=1 Tax=Pseudomonas phage OBP TaxID=1124849 RepID=UPI000240D49C|nr:internal head protein [Pseudomonas phage OBP]AEV89547.1 putative virion structural protein [Pseudomonas phage OBP]
MSFKDMFTSIAGQESADLTPEVIEVAAVTAEEAAEAIIEKELAVHEKDQVEAIALVEKHDNAIEVLEEKIEELQECVDGMEAMSNGSRDFNAELFTHFHKTAIKHANSFGAKMQYQGVENFADVGLAQVNGFEALKDLKEVASKGKEAAKKFLAELFAQVSAAIGALFNGAGAMAKKAEAMKAALGKKESKEGDITISGLLKDNGADDFLNKLTGAFGIVSSGGSEEGAAAKVAEALKFGAGESRSVKALSIADCGSRLTEVINFGKGIQTIKGKAEALVKSNDAAAAKLFKERSADATDKFDATKAQSEMRKSVKELLAGIRTGGEVLKAKLKAVQDSVQDKKED